MAEIMVLDGYSVPQFTRSNSRRTSRKSTGRSSMSAKAKFKKVAKVCNKKKGKAAKKACWREHYK